MLRALNIKNFIIVESLDLEFDGHGFVALTGETGAGKSILIGALSLLLGERVDSKVVRDGCERAEVSAEFCIEESGPIKQILQENGLFDREVCVLRRTFDNKGRSRAWINGVSATLGQMKNIGVHLVNIHGQHDHQLLTRFSEQRDLLDKYSGAQELAFQVAEKWQKWQLAITDRKKAEQETAYNSKQLDHLRWQLREMQVVDYTKQEWPGIEAEHKKLSNVASLSSGVGEFLDALSEGENSLLDQITSIKKHLDSVIQHDDSLKELAGMIDLAEIQLREGSVVAKNYHHNLELEPGYLLELEKKVDEIFSLSHKHRESPENLPDLKANIEREISGLEAIADFKNLSALETELGEQFEKMACELTKSRENGARKLEQKVTEVFNMLGMTDKIFQIVLTNQPSGSAAGMERVEFCMSNKVLSQPQPISKVASGGELSRISLGIQAVMGSVVSVPTMIFDEVDAGIGGGIAEIVGHLLKQLGSTHQVMCVTHLAQVASAAQSQWRIFKKNDSKSVSSSAELLDRNDRIKEIARMIGGIDITETTIKHATELLDAASA